MQKTMVISLMLVSLFVFSLGGFAQGFNISDWKILSEENKTEELTDTVFLGKPCLKLDGKIRSAIWNRSADFSNFRMELDIAGAVMSGIGFHAKDEQNYQFMYFRPGYGGHRRSRTVYSGL